MLLLKYSSESMNKSRSKFVLMIHSFYIVNTWAVGAKLHESQKRHNFCHHVFTFLANCSRFLGKVWDVYSEGCYWNSSIPNKSEELL